MDAKTKKQSILLLVLSVVLLVFLWTNLIGPLFSKQRPRPDMVFQGIEGISMTKMTGKTSQHADMIRKFEQRKWARNPFKSPFRGRVVTAEMIRRPTPKFKLEGIVWDHAKAYAIIDGEIHEIGDEIQAFKVMEISDDKVILGDGKEELTLRLFPELL